MADIEALQDQQARLMAALDRIAAAASAASAAQATPPPAPMVDVTALQAELEAERAESARLQEQVGQLTALLETAQERAIGLENALSEAQAAVPDSMSADTSGEVAALQAKLDALTAAREEDLAEVKALLNELDPLLEQGGPDA